MKRSGDPVWCEVTITPKNATHDEEKRNIAVVIDISRRKLAEEAREILNDELAHRLKNSMNIVGSLVRFAKQSAPDVNSYEASISGQLKALSVAQEWLFKSDWRGVDFDDLCSEILKPFQVDGSERFLIDVPSPRLPPQLAQIMSLVIHELATNATKYGALSNNEGTVRLEGSVKNYSADGGKSFDELHLVWIENGGPPVKIPTRKGFGTSILNRIVRDQLYGEFNPQWNKDGLHCEIKIRL